jgi:cobalt-zinc-cadmium efflux system outer membrane protein
MRRLFIPLVSLLAGCRACPVDVAAEVEAQAAAVAPVRATPEALPCGADEPAPPEGLDLLALWQLALANNPALREAAADVEAARGRLLQAGKYPNPRVGYTEEELGTRQNAAGAIAVVVNQAIVTAGKRGLDVAIAARGTDAASLALLGRKFEVLTRLRRAYYDYLGWRYAVAVDEEVLDALHKGVEITRKQVEEVQLRPRADLLRLQAVLEEAKITRDRSRVSREAAWRQLAAEVGVPGLAVPEAGREWNDAVPQWEAAAVVGRVLAANTELKQAALEADQARLEVERAQAEAVPNVTVGGGYSRNFAENEAGAIVSVETDLPFWDRKQGRGHEARARWAKAQAARRTIALRLHRDTAEAFGRYQAARQQFDGLNKEVLPRLVESLNLVRRSYQAGGAQITFADVLLAEQTLNDTRLRVTEVRRELWRAIADLQGLMELDVDEDMR